MHTAMLEKPRTYTQQDYMHIARWMVGYVNRFAGGRYDEILTLLHRSQTRAGGPALRLAQALWAFHYRNMYPDDKRWEVEEENTFAHLMHHHMEKAKSHYRVFRAMEIFATMRLHVYRDLLLKTIELDPADTPNPLRRALRRFDETVLGAHKRVRQHHMLKRVMQALGRANPADDEIMLAAINAAHALAVWRIDTTRGEAFADFQQAANTALGLRYRNLAYLAHKNPQLEEAILLLGKALNQPRA